MCTLAPAVLQAPVGTAVVPEWDEDRILCMQCFWFCVHEHCFATEGCCTQETEWLCCKHVHTCCDTMPKQYGSCTCCVSLPGGCCCCATPRQIAEKVRKALAADPSRGLPRPPAAYRRPPGSSPVITPAAACSSPRIWLHCAKHAHTRMPRGARATVCCRFDLQLHAAWRQHAQQRKRGTPQ